MNSKIDTTNDGITIKEVNYQEYYAIIKQLNETVFNEELSFTNKEYNEDKYDQYSAHFLTMYNDDNIGYFRIINPNPHRLPAFEVTEIIEDIDLNKSVELSKLMLLKEYRKNVARIGLISVSNTAKYMMKNRFHKTIVDVFVDSKVYNICKQFGYKEISKHYYDPRYLFKKLSVVMMVNIPEIINAYRLYQYMKKDFPDIELDNYMLDYMKYLQQ